LLGLALIQAFTRWYWDQEYIERQKSIFFTLLIFLIGIAIVFILILFPFAGYASSLLFDRPDFSYLIKLMGVSAALQMLYMVPLTLMKLQEKPAFYSVSNILKLAVTLLLTIFFVVFRRRGLEGIFEAQIVGGLFFFVITSKYIFRNIVTKFEGKILSGMLSFSFPLIFGSISAILLSTFDRYTLNYLTGLSAVAVYTLGFKIANTIKVLVISSVQLAISPKIFQMMIKEGNQRFYSKIMTYFSYLVILVVLAVSLFSLEIVKVFSHSINYWDAAPVIPIISFSLFFGMLKETSLIGLQIAKKTRIIGTVIFFIAALNLGLNLLFIPKYGLLGASVATLVSQVVFFLVIFIFAQKAYYVPYEIWKISKMTMLALLLYFLAGFTGDMSLLFRLIIKFSILLSFPFLLYFIGYYEKTEIHAIRGMWMKWRDPKNWRENVTEIFNSDF